MRKLTTIIILLTVLLLGGYDIWVYVKAGTPATISWIIWDSAKGNPMIPLMFGILMGHFFWQMECPKCKGNKDGKVLDPSGDQNKNPKGH